MQHNLPKKSQAGRHARHPFAIPWRGWWDILRRVQKEITNDALQLLSAGIAFYFFLSVFPILAAIISIYGIFVTPAGAEMQIEELGKLLPTQSQEVISEITNNVTSKSAATLGWGLVLTILLSLWSANKGTRAFVRGLNVAYGEKETRNWFQQTALTLVVTLGSLPRGHASSCPRCRGARLCQILSYSRSTGYGPHLGTLALDGCSYCIHFRRPLSLGSQPQNPRWQWISAGSIFGVTFWLLGSAGFSYYVDNYDMGKTYGSFAAVVSLLLWFFLTAFVILIGAEINCESERQTARDTTIGPPRPKGKRGSAAADEVAVGDEVEEEDNPLGGL